MQIDKNDNELRMAMFEIFKGRCFYTGRLLDSSTFHVDHVVPKSKGGLDDVFNYVACDPSANSMKGDAIDDSLVDRMLYIVKLSFAPRVISLVNKIKDEGMFYGMKWRYDHMIALDVWSNNADLLNLYKLIYRLEKKALETQLVNFELFPSLHDVLKPMTDRGFCLKTADCRTKRGLIKEIITLCWLGITNADNILPELSDEPQWPFNDME